MASIDRVSPSDLQQRLAHNQELAVIDVREELDFAASHLLWATSVPLSRLELKFPALVPRLATPIILCDGGDGLSQQAAGILASCGYSHLCVLDGGVSACAQAGLELFSGVNVPSKAFGEFIEQTQHTPGITALELDQNLRSGADVIVVDSRPFDEYARMSIPTAVNVPGAELVLRIRDLAPSPRTLVVVNCAGRTRSIIGAQSLIDARVPNRVAALINGTMGWQLTGLRLESGRDRRPPQLSAQALKWASDAVRALAAKYGLQQIDLPTLRSWEAQRHARTLFVFDVRSPDEYRAGHIRGAVSAPGGQVVQATDHYLATRGARIVLVDDLGVRAYMTAAWLRRMGWGEVAVLAEVGHDTSVPPTPVLAQQKPPAASRLEVGELATLLAQDAATLIDLSLSTHYRKGHIPGAWFAIRSRLRKAWPAISARPQIVLTCEDGTLAELAVAEAACLTGCPVRFLRGGNAAWSGAGRPLTVGEDRMLDEPVDVWLRPYEEQGNFEKAMADYLAWETGLPERIKQDGPCRAWY